MNDFVGQSPEMEELLEGMTEGLTSVDFFSNTWSSMLSIAAYVFLAIGMYVIAKRRGIKHPWLAWIPYGSTWLLGCISDQFRYVTMGQQKSKRKVMLGLEIAVSAVGTVAIVLMIVAIIKLFGQLGNEYYNESAYMAEILSPLMICLVLFCVMLGFAIALTVLQYMAVYDLFRSCNPNTATIFLVLSIVLSLFGIGQVLMGIFVFAVRNKDLGMMPPQPVYNQPVFQPQPPQPPMWQPPQPPVEPWEQNDQQF